MTEDEKKVFRQAMQGVKPLASDKSVEATRQVKNLTKKPKIQTTKLDLTQVSDSYPISDENKMEFVRGGIQHKVFKRLKRGDMEYKAKLDLHGFTLDTAREEVVKFIHLSYVNRLKSVIIIHGKGNRSHNKFAVLKPKVNIWLRQLDSVLAFCPAQPHDGGAGALYVLLKMSNEQAN